MQVDDEEELETEFLSLVGNSLERFFAVANVEIEHDELRGRIFEWADQKWRLFYADEEDICTDLAIFADGTIYISRDDGSLLEITPTRQIVIQTEERRGTLLTVVNENSLLVTGKYLSLFDSQTKQFTRLNERSLSWEVARVFGETIYVIEMGMRVVRICDKQLEFFPYDRTTRLADVCLSSSGTIFSGGWREGFTGYFQCWDGAAWCEIPLPTTGSVRGIFNRDDELVILVGGSIWAFEENSRTWKRDSGFTEEAHDLFKVGDELLARQYITGEIFVWQLGQWKKAVPPIPL